jgi:hypothetical protein
VVGLVVADETVVGVNVTTGTVVGVLVGKVVVDEAAVDVTDVLDPPVAAVVGSPDVGTVVSACPLPPQATATTAKCTTINRKPQLLTIPPSSQAPFGRLVAP